MEIDQALPHPKVRMYCNRTLNLRSTKIIGFDMDYTLVHYRTREWEEHAYEHAKRELAAQGFPVQELVFDPDFAMLGLILDFEHGNLIKANRFGFVKKAAHGTRSLEFPEVRALYAREIVDLADSRYRFLNTLFALSEACLYAQCVDLLDAGKLKGPMGYREVYLAVRESINAAHMLGQLKAEIMDNPDRFVELDEQLPLALLDLKHAGKKLLLITNSEWFYTRAMMSYAFDRFLPEGQTWRDLFDIVIAAARKPDFFSARAPVFEVVDEETGALMPVVGDVIKEGGAYVGGNAAMVEASLRVSGEDILYVGDHIFTDVNVSKKTHRWRTALVVRELEADLDALEAFKEGQANLSAMMQEKAKLEHQFSQLRLALQRKRRGYGPQVQDSEEALEAAMHTLRETLVALDEKISPLARESSTLNHPRWGLLMRTGNDKSHLARQIEKNADVYMARVSNLLAQTPFVYLRAPRGSLPHDPGPLDGAE